MFSGNSPKSEELAIWLKHLFVSTEQRVSSWQISNNETNETSYYFRAATDQLVLAVPNLDNQLAKNDFQDAIADAARGQCKIVQIVPAGNENLTVDHRYPVIIISETAESAVIDLVSGLTQYGCIIRTPREDDSTRLMVDAETVLPRLKRVSNRALQDAATVGEKRFESERQSTTDTALYVKRDLENAIVEKLATTSCILVSGPAGAGKTSLLWGIAETITSDGQLSEVYFVKAPSLISSDNNPPLVSPEELIKAVAHQVKNDIKVVVLLDTADLIVNDERSSLILSEVIDGIIDGGGRIVITSRPAEASQINGANIIRMTLGSYTLEPPPHGGEPEFTRAVAIHAIAYCNRPGEANRIANQLSNAVIRQSPLGEMARHPLYLRMLFDLYSPGEVPLEVDPTSLFDQYWHERVESDRRNWSPPTSSTSSDLSHVVKQLAHEMLRMGMPQIALSDIPLKSSMEGRNFRQNVQELCNRGVGYLTANNIFTFFHQTFFEYSAAQDLITSHMGALKVLINHSMQNLDDYFRMPVLEQPWLCAWRTTLARAEAEECATKYLSTDAPSALRRLAIRVAAQSPALPGVQQSLLNLLAGEEPQAKDEEASGGHASLVKEYLGLRPRPGSIWTDLDNELLVRLRLKGDPIWHACVEVLNRLASYNSEEAQRAITHIHNHTPVPFLSKDQLKHQSTKDLLAFQAKHYPQDVFNVLHEGYTHAGASKTNYVLKVSKILLAVNDEYAMQAAAWADDHDRSSSPDQVWEHARLHSRVLESSTEPIQWDKILQRCRDELGKIADSKKVNSTPPAFVWGILEALDVINSAERDTEILDIIFDCSSPRVHEQIHHGWLVSIANRSNSARDRMARILVDGFPALHGAPRDDKARWSDTIRRTIAHDSISTEARVDILKRALGFLDSTSEPQDIWLDSGALMRSLLPAACSDMNSAWQVLDYMESNSGIFGNSDWEEIFESYPIVRHEPRTADVLELAALHGKLSIIQTALKHIPDVPWSDDMKRTVRARAIEGIRSANPQERKTGVLVYQLATYHGHLDFPEAEEMYDLLAKLHESDIPVGLGEMIMQGIRRGIYDVAKCVALVEVSPRSFSGIPENGLSFGLQRQTLLVSLLAMDRRHWSIVELVNLAFLPSHNGRVDGGVVHKLVGALVPNDLGFASWSTSDKVDLLIQVGTALNRSDVGTSVRKDIPAKWRNVIWGVLTDASIRDHKRLALALPDMETKFARRVAIRLPVNNDPDLRSILTEYLESPHFDEDVKRYIEYAFERGIISHVDWPSMDNDLATSPDTFGS